MYNLKHTVVFVSGTFYPVLSDCGWLPATEIELTEITEGGEGEGGLEFEMVAGGGGLAPPNKGLISFKPHSLL